MSAAVVGALIGLVLGLMSFAALKALAGRVELDETKRVLNVTGIIDLILFPAVGWFVGPLFSGD